MTPLDATERLLDLCALIALLLAVWIFLGSRWCQRFIRWLDQQDWKD